MTTTMTKPATTATATTKPTDKPLTLTIEAKSALRHHGPNTAQLIKMLNGNDEEDMPSSRHVRWMAAYLLVGRGINVPGISMADLDAS